ncbi:hypothetical protein GE09DRAFT_1224609 [Coniochaeta sp. 2T2.1]|nr:hypothetical protein GE09DRAFT_1224609 [Coniochaeta sp. 2T2.1]
MILLNSLAALANRTVARQTLLRLTPPSPSVLNTKPSHRRLHHHVRQPPHHHSGPTTLRPNFFTAPSLIPQTRTFISQTNTKGKPSSKPNNHLSLSRPTRLLALLLASLAAFKLAQLARHRQSLNPDSFVPFTITAREQVSPTAFILTVQPTASISSSSSWTGPGGGNAILEWLQGWVLPSGMETRASNRFFRQIWEEGKTWSVEVKQPMLQVARDYTPLPRGLAEREAEEEEGARERTTPPELKFLIRKMDGGEVSTYLSGLGVGDQVELRGPHYGFDVRKRLGDVGRVVFLAGGTGIAPALQVVKAVLDGDKKKRGNEGGVVTEKEGLPKVDIIWANRHRDDCRTCPGLGSVTGDLEDGERGRVLDQLAEIQKMYPGSVSVRCTVDDERSFIDARAVARLLTAGPVVQAGGEEARDCWLHSQEAVAWRPATDIDATKKDAVEEDCLCTGRSGKNLLFVSGPEGFVEHFAGPKRWANGAELQGPVGGVMGKLRAQHPDATKDWLVLKL